MDRDYKCGPHRHSHTAGSRLRDERFRLRCVNGCQADRLTADTLDDAVLRAAVDTFKRTDVIDDAARAAFERSGVNRHNREEELATVKAALKDTEDSIERYLAAFESRTMPEALCGERIRTLGVRVVELRERREDLEASLDADAVVLPTEQQIAAVRGKLREALEHGDRPARKRLLQSVVAEIRVYSRHKIQTYFRVPGTNDTPEGAVRAPCTRVVSRCHKAKPFALVDGVTVPAGAERRHPTGSRRPVGRSSWRRPPGMAPSSEAQMRRQRRGKSLRGSALRPASRLNGAAPAGCGRCERVRSVPCRRHPP